ncbi:hypothetical protein Hanom_Chr14g01320991 [Helianthus anomalus]
MGRHSIRILTLVFKCSKTLNLYLFHRRFILLLHAVIILPVVHSFHSSTSIIH